MTALTPHPLHQDCQKVSQMLARLGEKWSMLVVTLLRDGPRRFNDIKRNTGGISQ
jgi:DNA-binding HxlR family transcriptional regulator